jgi:hypothetical protein
MNGFRTADAPSHVPGDQVRHGLPAALVRNMGRLDSREMHQHARRQMPRRADTRRIEAELARLGLGQAYKLGERICRHALVHDQRLRPDAEPRDRCQIGQGVVARIGVDVRIDRHRADMNDDQRVAVGRAAGARDCPQVAAGAGAVLDHHRLAERRRQSIRQPARPDVGDAARTAGNDDAKGFARPRRALRPSRGDGGEAERPRQSKDASASGPHVTLPRDRGWNGADVG